jgi:integrase
MGKKVRDAAAVRDLAPKLQRRPRRELPQRRASRISARRLARARAAWGGSAADWNHLRRALSAFLTVHLDDVHHPFRRAHAEEDRAPPRESAVPDLPVETFWAIVDATPEHARPCYVTLAATGMRLGEYLGCERGTSCPRCTRSTCPARRPTRAPRASTSTRALAVDRAGHPVAARRELDAHLLAPRLPRARRSRRSVGRPASSRTVRVKRADGRRTTSPARRAVSARSSVTRYKGPTLHDLRHLYAQLADEEGATDTQVMGALRHSNPAQTREYKRRRAAGEVARMVGNQLLRRIS